MKNLVLVFSLGVIIIAGPAGMPIFRGYLLSQGKLDEAKATYLKILQSPNLP
jgi:hypothetical protein